jgi:hypothetical protein
MTESRECQTPSATTIARIRDQVIAFLVAGIMRDPGDNAKNPVAEPAQSSGRRDGL